MGGIGTQRGSTVGIGDLVDETAAVALEHAAELQRRLRCVDVPARPEVDADLHRLIGDIVSLRNAAELLKRAAPAS